MSATETRFVGAPLKRKEDGPLLQGRGSYVDNIDLPGTPPFSEVVCDRALLMLRAGWRRQLDGLERNVAEAASLTYRLVWWSEEAL